MMYLLFNIGNDRYALEAKSIVEILPCVRLKKIPGTPPGIAGVLNYYGATVPVVDLSGMSQGVPARESLSTRLVVVRYTVPHDDRKELLGVMMEGATQTARIAPELFREAGISSNPGPTPYLGPVASVPQSDGSVDLIQRVEIGQLLTGEVRERLWNDADAVASSASSASTDAP